jgi:hypothetical protein
VLGQGGGAGNQFEGDVAPEAHQTKPSTAARSGGVSDSLRRWGRRWSEMGCPRGGGPWQLSGGKTTSVAQYGSRGGWLTGWGAVPRRRGSLCGDGEVDPRTGRPVDDGVPRRRKKSGADLTDSLRWTATRRGGDRGRWRRSKTMQLGGGSSWRRAAAP